MFSCHNEEQNDTMLCCDDAQSSASHHRLPIPVPSAAAASACSLPSSGEAQSALIPTVTAITEDEDVKDNASAGRRKRTANRSSSTTCVGSSAFPAHNVLALRVAMVLMIAAIVSSDSNQVEALTLPPFFTRPPASPASEGTISSAASSTTALGPTKTPLQARDETIWKAGNLRDQFGTSALGQVRNLAAAVQTAGGKQVSRRGLFVARGKNTGGTGSLMRSLEKLDGENEDAGGEEVNEEDGEGVQNDKTVVTALTRLENDSEYLLLGRLPAIYVVLCRM